MLSKYREKYGKYPADLLDLQKSLESSGFTQEKWISLRNPDSRMGGYSNQDTNYVYLGVRPDGTADGEPHTLGARGVVVYAPSTTPGTRV
jgi:hypothetical protein